MVAVFEIIIKLDISTKLFRDPQAHSSALAALGVATAQGLWVSIDLNNTEPLVSMTNYYLIM